MPGGSSGSLPLMGPSRSALRTAARPARFPPLARARTIATRHYSRTVPSAFGPILRVPRRGFAAPLGAALLAGGLLLGAGGASAAAAAQPVELAAPYEYLGWGEP